LSQSCKLTFIADQEDLRAGHNTRKEMVASSKFTTELLGAIDGGIHLAPELTLCFSEGGNDILQRNALANHHHVDIACRCFAADCQGAVNEGELNLAGQGGETILQDLSDTKGFANKAVKLIEYRAGAVGLIIRLTAFHRSDENSGPGELREVPLHGSRAKADDADDLTLIEALAGVTKKEAQYGLPSGAEEGGADGVGQDGLLCTHIRYERTCFGFVCQADAHQSSSRLDGVQS
jgi:hypothetical protein